ncbi:MAG: sensor histidine kinase, partial [Gammaproteobacteria bacterium]
MLLLCLSTAASGQVVPITSDSNRLAIAERVEYYEDRSESLSITDVLAPSFAVNFVPHNRDVIHFGLSSSAYWIRFGFDWSGIAPGTTRILEFGPPKHVAGLQRGGIEIYTVNSSGNVLSDYILGSHLEQRELKTLNRGFALRIDASYGDMIYMRVSSARPLRLPLTVWEEESFRQQAMMSNMVLGLQYGILLALVFYNLFLFFSIREPSYIFYVAAIATQTAFLFLDSKHLRFNLDQMYRAGWGVDMAERLIYPLLVITALMFQRSLLRIWEHNLRLDRAMVLLLAGFGLIALLTPLPNEKIYQYLFIVLLIFTIPFTFYTNLDSIKRGNVTAVVHMAAMSVFLLGTVVLMLLQLLPGFPANAFTLNAYDVGLIAQALLLSLSLSFRYNQIKQEKEDAQRQAINNLVRSEQVKDDLLANVSHELRTPLYGINGLAETALQEFRRPRSDSELITKNLELIQASGDRLTKLVNDLLDFSAAREEATYVKFKPVDLNSLVTLVIAVCKPLIGDKNIELRAEID